MAARGWEVSSSTPPCVLGSLARRGASVPSQPHVADPATSPTQTSPWPPPHCSRCCSHSITTANITENATHALHAAHQRASGLLLASDACCAPARWQCGSFSSGGRPISFVPHEQVVFDRQLPVARSPHFTDGHLTNSLRPRTVISTSTQSCRSDSPPWLDELCYLLHGNASPITGGCFRRSLCAERFHKSANGWPPLLRWSPLSVEPMNTVARRPGVCDVDFGSLDVRQRARVTTTTSAHGERLEVAWHSLPDVIDDHVCARAFSTNLLRCSLIATSAPLASSVALAREPAVTYDAHPGHLRHLVCGRTDGRFLRPDEQRLAALRPVKHEDVQKHP